MESNSNYGKLLTDCMKEAGFDEMTYGNHEFDWGMDNLRTLASESNIPFLGANIYNWDRETGWGEFADDFADEYIIKELDNGLKVGVIGVIGEDQITSISSQLVQTIGFKDPLPIIKNLATELRTQQDCDVVVVSAHASPQQIVGEKDDYNAPSQTAGLENYVNGIFCAHTHAPQRYLLNGLPFLQGQRYGNYVSHMRFAVDNGNVSVQTYENIEYKSLNSVDAEVQSKVQTLIDNSNATIAAESKQVLATLLGSMNSDYGIPRMVCNAITDYSQSQGYTIDLAIVNYARNPLRAGALTYSQLYEAIPFDNVVYIAYVSGADIINEMNHGQSMWRVSGRAIRNADDQYYLVAVIDYLLFHQNTYRNYNYFPSAFKSGFEPIPLTKEGVDIYNYRLITRDFLLAQQAPIDTSIYLSNNINTDSSLLQQKVDLPIVPYQFGNNPTQGTTPQFVVLPVYAIVLIAVGAALLVAAVVVVLVVLLKKRRSNIE